MDEVITRKEKWCTALESGKYEQGAGFLYINGKFCCLGVLAEIDYDNIANGGSTFYGKSTDGIYYSEGISIEDSDKLMVMNDDEIPFSEIAKYIRENVEVEDFK